MVSWEEFEKLEAEVVRDLEDHWSHFEGWRLLAAKAAVEIELFAWRHSRRPRLDRARRAVVSPAVAWVEGKLRG